MTLSKDYPTPRAVVLHSTGVFYDNGTTHKLADRLKLADLSNVLWGGTQAFRGGEGVLLVDSPMPPQVPELVARNWKFSALKPWTTFVGNSMAVGNAVIHLGFLPDLFGENGRPGELLKGADGPKDAAWRLGRYHQLVGTPWRYTAGVSACAALRLKYTDPRPGKQPLWRSEGPRGVRAGGPIIWHAAEMPDPADPRIVAMFDVNAMYLAALKNVQWAWGALRQTGPIGFDPARPGYWEIGTDQLPAELIDGRTRPPLVRHISRGSGAVTTPMGKHLTELVGTIDVLDSWTCDNGQTIARPFAERLISVRNGDLGPMGPTDTAIKRTYAELVGMMGREGGSIDRKDWARSTADLGSANMLRRVEKGAAVTGLRPFEIRTDACYYLLDPAELPRLTAALGVGSAPGTFKNPKTCTVAEHYDATVVRA